MHDGVKSGYHPMSFFDTASTAEQLLSNARNIGSRGMLLLRRRNPREERDSRHHGQERSNARMAVIPFP
jgi:hypothetical protein